MDEEIAVTRSVKIPEEAVEAAHARYYEGTYNPVTSESLGAMRAALEVALPYLQRPTVVVHAGAELGLVAFAPESAAWVVDPAVPQPVDREALHLWIREEIERAIAFHAATKGSGHQAGEMCDGWSALTEAMQLMHDDAHELAAVLAGEQEQVEP